MNLYLVIILVLIGGEYLLNLWAGRLNLRVLNTEIPEEFQGVYDAERYQKAQDYLRDSTRFEQVTSTWTTVILVGFILAGGFRVMDQFARSFDLGLIGTGLVFGGVLMVGLQLLQLPFQIYSTFVLEERYGFNKTSPRTFAGDQIKGVVLTVLLGGLLFAGVIWFFAETGRWGWLYAWAGVTAFQGILVYVAPVWIMPLFNKFTPLEEGALNDAVTAYAQEQGFKLQGLFTMDGSRRSTKSNAYFTGFGRWRRVVLFDTLVEKHTVDELVAVLAHEIGHYKLKHIPKHMLTSIGVSGLMFYLLSLFLTQAGLYEAFQVAYVPVAGTPPLYAGILFFGFLFAPISMVVSIWGNARSRRHEFEADAFAAKTTGHVEAMIDALKKLSVDNLSNLTPHPLLVFLDYTHPPVLQRIRALKAISVDGGNGGSGTVRTVVAGILILLAVLPGCGGKAPEGWMQVEQDVREAHPGVRQLASEALTEWMGDTNRAAPVLLDVRRDDEYAVSHLPGALRLDPDTSPKAIPETLDRSSPIVLYCSVGYRSAAMAERLQEAGFQEVYNLEGSIFAWANEGRPLVSGDEESVERVHPYNRAWGRRLHPEKRWTPAGP